MLHLRGRHRDRGDSEGYSVVVPRTGTCEIDSVRVISHKALREFWKRPADSEVPLRAWFKETKEADWNEPLEIKERYASASFLANDRVVFNIKGNAYRLVVAVRYDFGIVYIRFVGTHAECDKIDAATI